MGFREKPKTSRKKDPQQKPSFGLFLVFLNTIPQRLNLLSKEIRYTPHLLVRYLHDVLYKKFRGYRRYSDNPVTETVHRAALTGFLASFMVFTILQYVVPNVFDFLRPSAVQASSTTKTWTVDADFNSNAVTTGVATTKGTVALAGTVTATNGSTAVTGSGTNWNTTVKNFPAPILINITGVSYTVSTVTDDTHLTLSSNYTGTTGAGKAISYDNVIVGSNALTLHPGQVMSATTLNTPGPSTWIAPAGVTSVQVETWGAGGNGFNGTTGGGGGGGGYAIKTAQTVIPGNSYTYSVAAGGGGANSYFIDNATVAASSGANATSNTGGSVGGFVAGTTGSSGTSGNNGSTNTDCTTNYDGGVGGNGANGGTGGFGAWDYYYDNVPGDCSIHDTGVAAGGTAPGGGGGGGVSGFAAGSGANGKIVITPIYSATGTLSALKIDAGLGKKAKWSNLSWTATTPAGTSVKFNVRTSDDNSTWSSWSADLTTAGGSALTGQTSTRYLELMATLTTTAAGFTPTLSDFTVSYDSLESPVNANTTLYRTDGTTKLKDNTGADVNAGTSPTGGAWTSETSVKMVTTGLSCTDCGTFTNPYIEVEVKPVGTAFDSGATGMALVQGAVDGANASTATITGLSVGTGYHLQMRAKDAQGRVSGWTSYGTNAESAADVTAEQTAPTSTVSINTGATYSASTSVTLTSSASDTGGAGLGQMRFSNDGVTWSDWETYNATKAWTIASGEGTQSVYAQYKDNAGNINGLVDTTTANFSGTFENAGIIGTNDEIKLTNAAIDTVQNVNLVADWNDTDCLGGGSTNSATVTDSTATQARVTWNWNNSFGSSAIYIGGVAVVSKGSGTGSETTGWYNGNSVYVNASAGICDIGYGHISQITFRKTEIPVSATYTSVAVANPALAKTITWSDKTNAPNGGTVTMKLRGGDDVAMTGATAWSVGLAKGANVPDNIKQKAYVQYQLTLASGGGQTTVPVVYDISLDMAISDSIILDTTPPANVLNLKAYTDSGKLTEMPGSTWQSVGNPYFEWTANGESDLAGYKYCFGASSCTPSTVVTPTATNNYITLDLTNQSTYPDNTYYFRIVAYDTAGNPSATPTQYIYKLDRTTPGAITGFTASQNQETLINLSWSNIYDPNGSPITYTIEKMFYSKYLEGFSIDDVGPDKIWSNQVAFGYESFAGLTGTPYVDNIALGNQGLKYVYRIKASDESGKVGPHQNAAVYGLTRDGINPTTPSSVVAVACSYQTPANCSDVNNNALKGHEVTLTWSPGTDGGTGIDRYLIYRAPNYSLLEADFTLMGTVIVPNPLPGGYNLTYTDGTSISDYTHYYYRVIAQDTSTPPNKSSFAPTNDENYVSIQTPDVTAPIAPTVTASPAGLDDSNNKQKTVITWIAATDTGVGIKTYKLYRAIQTPPDETDQSGTLVDGDFTDITSNPAVSCDLTARVCYEQGLDDLRYYYYRVKAIDNDPYNNISGFSTTATVKTLSSAVPTPPRGRIDPNTRAVEPYPYVLSTKGNPTDTNVGHEAKVYFSGSYEKDCIGGATTPCLVRYDIYRSIDNSTWAKRGEQIPTLVNDDRDNEYIYTDPGLNDTIKYYYQVRAVGNNQAIEGGGITSSNIGGSKNEGWDITPDVTAPTIPAGGLEVKVRDTHPNEVELRNIITWKVLTATTMPKRNGTSDFAKYIVHRETYNPDTNALLSDDVVSEISDMTLNYYMDVIGIAFADLKYIYYVQIQDNAGTAFVYPGTATVINSGYSNLSAKEYAPDSIIPSRAKPVLTAAVTLSNISVASAVVSWTTDQNADSLVQFRVKDTNDSYVAIGQIERTLSHQVRLFGLSPNTAYEYQVVSRNYLGNNVEDYGTLPPLTTSGFNITPGAVVSTTSTAEISWTTNLDASSAFVEYQLQRQPGDAAQGGTAGVEPATLTASPTSHKVVVKGLRSARTYTYKIKSISNDGYLSEYPSGSFASFATKSFDSAQFTLAPASSNVAERNITATTAQIVWQTESPTTSWVDYSTTAGVYDNAAGNNDLAGTHVVVIEGLVPGTKYYYRVRVKDANEVEYTSQEYSFTAILKPKISNMTVKNITPYDVTIAWDTNVDTETIVNWGKTTAYGEKRGKSGVSKVHELLIDNLEDNQEYHYQILAKDEAGNEVADTDKIVRTPLDTEGPKITNVKIDVLPMGESDSTSSVIVSWNTNKPATTLVEYDEGVIGGTYGKSSVEDTTLNNSHTVIIKGLTPASSYHYHLVSSDKRSNKTISQDYTFVTPSKEKSILQLILKSLEETFAWTRNLNQFFGNIGKRLTGR